MSIQDKLRMLSREQDPTRIDIQFDPQVQRMKGIAYHGMTPFDVPYMTEVAPNLWLGGCTNGLVLPAFIANVVSLYPWEQYTILHELNDEISVEMYDSEDQAFDQVKELAELVHELRFEGPTLVHCQAGLNRSSLIVAKVLINEGLAPADAIDLLREKRSPAVLCNPSFERWLLEGANHEQ